MRMMQRRMRSARYWIDTNRSSVLIAILVLIGIGAVFANISDRARASDPEQALIIKPAETGGDETVDQNQAGISVVVHVVGAVQAPGVYTLEGTARVFDAVEAAGGLREDASIDGVNMALPLVDGAQVRIPTQREIEETKHRDTFGVPTMTASETWGLVMQETASTQLINVNTADAPALETLPGIGPSTSAKIIAEREANGPFRSLSDLSRVSGIGVKKIEALEGFAEAR